MREKAQPLDKRRPRQSSHVTRPSNSDSNVQGSDFYVDLSTTLLENLNNFYGEDNWDPARFGRRHFLKGALADQLIPRLNRFLHRVGYGFGPADDVPSKFDRLISEYGEGLSNTYDQLSDEYSRRALVDVLAYRLLGYRRMKLWTNTSGYWAARARADSLPTEGTEVQTGIDVLRLAKTDLTPIGFPVTIYTRPAVVAHQFLLNHYAYEEREPPVWLREGDYVIDAGGAWGDTALRFAHEVGARGRIFVFEFEPTNLDILRKNLDLNPELASRITLVEKALWKDSTSTLDFTPTGPGTRVSGGSKGASEHQVASVAVDDFAASLPRIDFIKMDIEGAELFALRGAEQTIRKHRPRMAISLYHSLGDFVDIPAYLASLQLPYDYYIDHATIHAEETVLFAAPRSDVG